jgi:thiamine biosynthesis lipoprotein
VVLGLLLAVVLQPYEAVEPHMGTLFQIKLYAQNPQQAQAAFRAAFARIRQLDDILSDYKPDSELNLFCRHGHAELSADLFNVLKKAQDLAARSNGAFDITIGPLTHLWRRGHVPSPDIGFRKLHLNPARLDEPGMQLDAGGIAKGYAADAALEAITKLGIASALVAASGDLAFSNPPPGHRGWKIGIGEDGALTMELHNAAVSTSGSSQQHVDRGGVRYSHIIDPETGMGLTRDIRVSVIAPRAVTADGLATAISVLGEEKGRALIHGKPGVSAIINGRVK